MGRILIADDHPMCRVAARMALESLAASYDIDEAKDLAETDAKAEGADLILLDLMMPDMTGLSGLMRLSSRAEGAPVIVVTGRDGTEIVQLVRAVGAAGFVSKDAELDELANAASAVLKGEAWFPDLASDGAASDDEKNSDFCQRLGTLTAAERRVLAALSDGSLNKQIAIRLDISEITVKQHIKSILRKTGARNRTQAALMIQLYDDREKMRQSFLTGSVSEVTRGS